MKRFITYLYECERGNKSKNVGFIRVNVRGIETTMEVNINNFSHSNDIGNIFVLIYKKELLGIPLGEVKIVNGQNEERFSIQTENIMGSDFALKDVLGIGIRLESGYYIASCWRDEYGEAIARGEFRVQDDISETEEDNVWVEQAELDVNLEVAEERGIGNDELRNRDREMISKETATYEKIDLEQIRNLPTPNWHLSTNSFLVHGFWNYGYLVLQKEMEEDKEKLSLGVPGVFEKPEAVMAILFGFPTFSEIPEEMVAAEMNHSMTFPKKEKNQEPKVGTFGGWFVELHK